MLLPHMLMPQILAPNEWNETTNFGGHTGGHVHGRKNIHWGLKLEST